MEVLNPLLTYHYSGVWHHGDFGGTKGGGKAVRGFSPLVSKLYLVIRLLLHVLPDACGRETRVHLLRRMLSPDLHSHLVGGSVARTEASRPAVCVPTSTAHTWLSKLIHAGGRSSQGLGEVMVDILDSDEAPRRGGVG
jgi:hypothetical protein